MASKKAPYRYTGVLAAAPKPPRLRPSLLNPIEDPRQVWEKALAERWLALHEDCGVSPTDPDAPLHIAATLAFRHVGGFRKMLSTTRRRGAPQMPWKRVIKDFVIFQEMTKGIGKGQSQRQAAMHVAKKYPKLRLKADNAAAAVDRRFRRVKKQLEDGPELMAHFGAIVKRFLEQEAKARVEDPALSSEQQSEYATFLQVLQKMQGVDPLASLFQAYGHELRAALK